jgi:hypothetical protein
MSVVLVGSVCYVSQVSEQLQTQYERLHQVQLLLLSLLALLKEQPRVQISYEFLKVSTQKSCPRSPYCTPETHQPPASF